MFQAFPLAVGVANVVPWLEMMRHHPHYRTTASGGQGFAEMVEVVLNKRASAVLENAEI